MIKKSKAQVTLFVIVAIVIVTIIFLYFLLRNKGSIVPTEISFTSPEEYIKKCAKEATGNVSDLLISNGGYLNPGNYVLYKNKKVAFLCYTRTFYKSCIMQEPLYVEHLQDEIKTYVTPRIKDCFYSLQQEYEKRNYQVTKDDNPQITIILKPRKVEVNIKNDFEIKKGEEVKRYEDFSTSINHPIYDLANLAIEITNQEAKYCYFSVLGFSLLYPDIQVERVSVGQGLERGIVYVIQDKYTNKKLYFAVRSCQIPAGI